MENVNFANIKEGEFIKIAKSSIEEYDDTFNEELNKDKKDKCERSRLYADSNVKQ